MEEGKIAPFRRHGSDHTAMGRFGNVLLTNGETDFTIDARTGEVVRLFLTNTANSRFFSVRIPEARMKLVGGDNGRVEHEQFVEEVLVTPSERVVLDVLCDRPGRVTLEDGDSSVLAMIDVDAERVDRSFAAEFETLRSCPDLRAERARLSPDVNRPADKTVALIGVTPGTAHGPDAPAVAWEERMADANRMSTPETMVWKLVDPATGAENDAIDWEFRLGERVKIRVENQMQSDQPMPHPFHIHGERFLVLSRNAVPNPNLVWKDTVLVDAGETLDLLMETSNPGVWMAHCHIAEHLEGGMMFSFTVR
jgi:FtsP/CotA-like multicopper oxidase with cupredoxin domain